MCCVALYTNGLIFKKQGCFCEIWTHIWRFVTLLHTKPILQEVVSRNKVTIASFFFFRWKQASIASKHHHMNSVEWTGCAIVLCCSILIQVPDGPLISFSLDPCWVRCSLSALWMNCFALWALCDTADSSCSAVYFCVPDSIMPVNPSTVETSRSPWVHMVEFVSIQASLYSSIGI